MLLCWYGSKVNALTFRSFDIHLLLKNGVSADITVSVQMQPISMSIYSINFRDFHTINEYVIIIS